MIGQRAATSRIAVVGGGLIGLFTAVYLREAGHAVDLFDSRDLVAEASWAGGGIISPLRPWHEPESVWTLARRGMYLVEHWSKRLLAAGIDVEYQRSGMRVYDEVDIIQAWCREQAVECSVASESSVFLPWVSQVRTNRYGRAVVRYAQSLGVRLFPWTPVRTLTPRKDSTTLSFDGAVRSFDAAVVTAGAWSSSVMDSAGLTLDVRPVRGQMLQLGASRHSDLDTIRQPRGAYAIPRRDGSVIVGSPLEHAGYDRLPTSDGMRQLLDAVDAIVPDASERPVLAQWAGLRPWAARPEPIIGQHPVSPSLWLNTGHFRNGVTLAAASAEHLEAVMAGRAAPQPAFAIDSA